MIAKEYALAVDTVACVGCFSCEVACKQEHNLPVGPKWTAVLEDPIRVIEGKRQLRYTVTHCMHCHIPKCKDACPENAITRRADGVVLIDAKICNGCRMCMEACPFGVIQFDAANGLAHKCDLCVDRLDKGKQPACVAACMSHCIYAGDIADVMKQVGASRLLLWYKNS
ncbi:MAG: 4Fe-4S binding protein [Chloroflexi bacterium]|nr:4Fe-4S binding protein [Chloroflexota bacterium]